MFTRVWATTIAIALGMAITGYADNAQTSKTDGVHGQLKTAEDVANKLCMLNHKEIKCGQLGQRKSENAEVKELARTLEADHKQANEKVKQFAQAKNITLEEPAESHDPREGHPGEPGSVGTPGTQGTPGNQRDPAPRDTTNDDQSVAAPAPTAGTDGDVRQGRPGEPGSVGTPGTQGTPGNQRDPAPRDATDDERADTTSAKHDKLDHGNHNEQEKMRRLETLSGEQFDREYTTMVAQAHMKAIRELTSAKSHVEDAEAKKLIESMLPDLEKHKEQAANLSRKFGGNPDEEHPSENPSTK